MELNYYYYCCYNYYYCYYNYYYALHGLDSSLSYLIAIFWMLSSLRPCIYLIYTEVQLLRIHHCPFSSNGSNIMLCNLFFHFPIKYSVQSLSFSCSAHGVTARSGSASHFYNCFIPPVRSLPISLLPFGLYVNINLTYLSYFFLQMWLIYLCLFSYSVKKCLIFLLHVRVVVSLKTWPHKHV
jgi:hypothetical protein